MSNNDAIRSKVEAIDSVVRRFSDDIDTFKTDVSSKIDEVDNALGRLSNVWEGTLQQNFDEKMRARQSQMRSALHRAGALKDKLDGIAAEMRAMLDILNAAGEDA
ncbi:MAG: hypothetical protein IJY50_09500 [Clostridia bacterium]|nr:hypothetical protein [Clostridia bacterium]